MKSIITQNKLVILYSLIELKKKKPLLYEKTQNHRPRFERVDKNKGLCLSNYLLSVAFFIFYLQGSGSPTYTIIHRSLSPPPPIVIVQHCQRLNHFHCFEIQERSRSICKHPELKKWGLI